MKCKKCDSADLVTRFVESGSLIDSSSLVMVNNDFVISSEYDFYWKLTANKDHLQKNCRNCQYSWRENCKDDECKTS